MKTKKSKLKKSSATAAAREVLAEQAINEERKRHIIEENWTSEHDDQRMKGELAIAALCYVQGARENSPTLSTWWPWDPKDFKPFKADTCEVDRERCLVKAGALILAEQDRLNRMLKNVVTELSKIKSK